VLNHRLKHERRELAKCYPSVIVGLRNESMKDNEGDLEDNPEVPANQRSRVLDVSVAADRWGI
jgi:hypothetical protein